MNHACFAADYVMFVNNLAINVNTFFVFKYENNAYKLTKHAAEEYKE